MQFDGLCDTKSGIHRARKRHRQQDQRGLMFLHGLQRELLQQRVNQIRRRGQCIGKRIKTRLATGQRFAVAHEFKTRIYCVTQHIGNVVQIQRSQMPRPVLLTQCTEGPAECVATLVIKCIKRGKARTFRQKTTPGDAVAQRGVAPLQKRNRRCNALLVTREMVEECIHAGAAFGFGQSQCNDPYLRQHRRRQQLQHQSQS